MDVATWRFQGNRNFNIENTRLALYKILARVNDRKSRYGTWRRSFNFLSFQLFDARPRDRDYPGASSSYYFATRFQDFGGEMHLSFRRVASSGFDGVPRPSELSSSMISVRAKALARQTTTARDV